MKRLPLPPVVSCFVFCVSCFLTACDRSAPTPKPSPSPTATPEPSAPLPTSSGKPQIAIIPHDVPNASTHPYQTGIDKILSEAKKGADGKPTFEVLLNTDPGTQADRAKSLLKSGVAVLIIAPDNQQTLDTITTAAGRTPIVALDPDASINTEKCKTTITPDKSASRESADEALAYTALKTANDLIREKKVEKQITAKPPTP